MINWILASSILIIAVLLIRKIFEEKLTPGIRYGLWLLVAVRLLIPFSFYHSSYSLPDIMNRAVAAVKGAGGQEDADAEPDEKFYPEEDAVDTADHAYYVPAKEPLMEEFRTDQGMASGDFALFYILWLVGMAVTGGIFLLANLFFRIRIYSDREEIEEEELKERGLSSGVPVYVSGFAATPCLAGLREPAVYLPLALWQEYTEKGAGREKADRELNAMLCHENVHYRHGDQFWGVLRLLCLVLHWYNPLVWTAALASKRDAELFCDAGAVRRLGEENRFEYGRVLLSVTARADENFGRRPGLLKHAGLCNTEMADTKKHLEQRIEKLTGMPKKSTIAAALTVLLSLMAFGYLFIGSGEQESLFWRITTGNDREEGAPVITESDQPDEAEEVFFPAEEEVNEVRAKALQGMSVEETDALTAWIKNYHNWMEYRLLYENWEKRLSDPESAAWNFIDRTGEVQAGWILEDNPSDYLEAGEEGMEYLRENYPEFGQVSLEELERKYGEPFYEESPYGADTVIQRIKELTASSENEAFQSDVEALCTALRQAKDTHEVSYVMQAHAILHDMEYFLLRYSPRDVAPYTQDKSLSGRYYGALEVWRAWREGGL